MNTARALAGGSFLAATLIAVLQLGCQVNGNPTPEPTASPTAEPTPTPTAEPTPTPTAEPTPTPTAEPTPTPTPTPTPAPRLFIANFNGNNVTSYEDPAGVNGNIAPDTNLQGAQTQLTQPSDIVVNAEGQLIASNFAGNSITSYDDAANANGNLEPDGNVQGAATQLIGPTSLAIDSNQDLLFVSDITIDVINVYANTTESSFNGNLPPVRTITTATSGDLNNPVGINLDANGSLYVANNGGNNILVFENAANLNGDLTPTRIINSAAFTNVFDVFINEDDTMFVVDVTGAIFTFNDASSLNGNQAPDFTLQIPAAAQLTAIAVDTEGTGYIVDATANAVFVYENIATRNGALNPDRTIQGANTQLNQPIRVFLVESSED